MPRVRSARNRDARDGARRAGSGQAQPDAHIEDPAPDAAATNANAPQVDLVNLATLLQLGPNQVNALRALLQQYQQPQVPQPGPHVAQDRAMGNMGGNMAGIHGANGFGGIGGHMGAGGGNGLGGFGYGIAGANAGNPGGFNGGGFHAGGFNAGGVYGGGAPRQPNQPYLNQGGLGLNPAAYNEYLMDDEEEIVSFDDPPDRFVPLPQGLRPLRFRH